MSSWRVTMTRVMTNTCMYVGVTKGTWVLELQRPKFIAELSHFLAD